MQYRDIAGQALNEGDQVFFGTAFGQAIVGTVQKTDSVLGANPQAAPLVHISFVLSLPAMPNGLVGGVLKIVPPTPQISE